MHNHPRSCPCWSCTDRRDRRRQAVTTTFAAVAFFILGVVFMYALRHPDPTHARVTPPTKIER